MTDTTVPYVEQAPGDILTADAWNDMQRKIHADIEASSQAAAASVTHVANADDAAHLEGKDLADLTAEVTKRVLDDVRGQIEELSALVGDLVELARDEPVPPTVEPVELTAVLEQAVARVRRRADVQFVVQSSPWWVTGDADALERAITNLLDNAAKWSPEGGVVQVALQHGTLMVADQGPGIAPEDLPHVFERFYRSAESRGMPGSGLGLSIVRSIAERHGGSVRAGASPDGGAAFWLTVPGQPSPPDA